MFKQLTTILLITAFFAQTFNGGFILLDYYINTGAFAKNCVNKATSALHCNGKCQMVKKLKQEENSNKQNRGRRGENKTEVLYFSANQYASQLNPVLLNIAYPPFNNRLTNKMAFDFFQPPRA